jgi:hypothetical protein
MKKLTKDEAIAECYRLVSEHERKLPPYERELFLQRLARRLKAPLVRSRTIVDGGCVVLASRCLSTEPIGRPGEAVTVSSTPREQQKRDCMRTLTNTDAETGLNKC